MTTLHVSLFGQMQIRYGDLPVIQIDARKAQELFCYLLLFNDRHHCREALSDVLWHYNPAHQSKKYLRQALWQIHSSLEQKTHHTPIILANAEWIRINPQADIRLDTCEFEQLYTSFQSAPQNIPLEAHIQQLQYMVTLYKGDLLEDIYQDWCIFERDRYQRMYLSVLDKLTYYCEASGLFEQGLIYGSQILRYDCARECAHQRLMRLHYLNGDRTAALRQYRVCLEALSDELDVAPARKTTELYEQIRADQLDRPSRTMISSAVVPQLSNSPHAPPEMYFHLKQLQSSLTDLQHQIEDSLQVLELTATHKS